jgi:oligopeptide/dipeptide ABC transporter ATP-binding protein
VDKPICEIKNLCIDYPISIGTVRAVEDASLNLYSAKTLGLVGESGCGKSTLGLSLLKLARPPGKIRKGQILFHGKDILSIKDREVLKMRGRDIAMIFQNPLTSLNPLFKIEDQFYETMKHHEPGISRDMAHCRAEELMETLGIEKKRLSEYAHQLSGGMRQRIMIGLALIMDPDILIADEPTTSLDVIVEAGFIDLLDNLRKKYNLSVLVISHNLGLVAAIADRVAVMYGGKIIETGPADKVYHNPLHPYTYGLINCVPNIKLEQKELYTMPGSPPDLVNPPPGCRFSPRCPKVMDRCKVEHPELVQKEDQKVACWLY